MIRWLRNAEIYAPEPQGPQDLLIGGERILWMGSTAPSINSELISEVADLAGARVIPGLVDCHVHLTGGGGEAGPATNVPPVPLTTFTQAGTTSVVGVLGTDDLSRSTEALVTSARALVQQGISAWCLTGGYHLPPRTLTGSVGSDILHVDRIVGVGEVAISDHRSSQPTLDEILRVAAQAHVAGLLSGKAGILHLHLGDGARGLDLVRRSLEQSEIPPRVFHPTHVNRRRALFSEALEVVSRGCCIDVTAFPETDSEDEVSAVEAIETFLDSGLPSGALTVSSDSGGSLPTFGDDGRVTGLEVATPRVLIEALQTLLGRSRSLEDILPPFTSNVAALFRLERKGRIAPGMDADLLVLDGRNEITDVMARGKWHLRGGRTTVRGMFEQAAPHQRGNVP